MGKKHCFFFYDLLCIFMSMKSCMFSVIWMLYMFNNSIHICRQLHRLPMVHGLKWFRSLLIANVNTEQEHRERGEQGAGTWFEQLCILLRCSTLPAAKEVGKNLFKIALKLHFSYLSLYPDLTGHTLTP